jgi:hypothetical protein
LDEHTEADVAQKSLFAVKGAYGILARLVHCSSVLALLFFPSQAGLEAIKGDDPLLRRQSVL